MAGHNKWSKVKHVKGALDAKKGKLFTKLIKEIMVAARLGGGNLDGNARLRSAVQAAKDASMPKDNIERAIKKATGAGAEGNIEECVYEGYGPGGVAVIVESTTDNKNRTVSDMRRLFKTGGGNLGETGSVLWMFERCGQLVFDGEKHSEDTIMEVALDAGAQDVSQGNDVIEVTTSPNEVYSVKEKFDNVGMHPQAAGLGYTAKNRIKVEDKEHAEKLIKLLQTLEDHDDVQKVHSNFDMDDDLLSAVTS